MFNNFPDQRCTYDAERKIALRSFAFGPDSYQGFLLEWEERKILFVAEMQTPIPKRGGLSVVSWEIISLGCGLTRSGLAPYVFRDTNERRQTCAIIRKALSVYVFPYGRRPNVIGEISFKLLPHEG